MCGPDCNVSPNGSCWRLPPPKDISMYRPGKKRGRSGNRTPSWQQQSQPQINIFVGDWTKTPNS